MKEVKSAGAAALTVAFVAVVWALLDLVFCPLLGTTPTSWSGSLFFFSFTAAWVARA